MNAKTVARASVSLVCASVLLGCATIMHGTHEDVGIGSSPSGASVTIDNIQHGMTPVIAKLTRKDNHVVTISMPDYATFSATVTRGVSGWVWGNIVFGGLIGLAVDAISGGIYKLTPEQISGTLAQARAMNDGIYIRVVLRPAADWTKIAQLAR